MVYWPEWEYLAEGLEEWAIELRPIPTIHDEDYGYFRPRYIELLPKKSKFW